MNAETKFNAEGGLRLAVLREANSERLPQFLNSKGYPAHGRADGSDWTPAQWLQATIGELGEFANIRKKFERGDITFEEYQLMAQMELADVATYLDLLAKRCLDVTEYVGPSGNTSLIRNTPHPTGIDLGAAIVEKFNLVSRRVKSSVRMSLLNWWHLTPSEIAQESEQEAFDRGG